MLPWWTLALLAALFWGASYPLTERVLRDYSWQTVLAIEAVAHVLLFGLIAWLSPTRIEDWQTAQARPDTLWVFALLVAVNLGALIFVTVSIGAKNSTLAAMVEASYLVWIPLFALFITGSSGLNWATAFGSVLILAGCVVLMRFG